MPRRVIVAIGAVLAVLATVQALAKHAPSGAPATCDHQSGASFGVRPTDLRSGPLVLVGGGRPATPDAVARLGGMKYPALVMAGHHAVLEVERRDSAAASLSYADEVHGAGDRTVASGVRVVDFRSCSAGQAQSRYGGRPATFWSGFILSSAPRCVHLRVWADGARSPRRVRVALGRACS